MPKAKKSALRSRKRHGSRQKILAIFKSGGSGEKRTSQIFAALKDASIPAQSVYQALRTLVKRKQLSVRKAGRERHYTWIGGAGKGKKAVSAPKPARVSRPIRTAPKVPVFTPVPVPTEVAAAIADETAMSVVAAEPHEKTLHKLVP